MRLLCALALFCAFLFSEAAVALSLDGRVVNAQTSEPVPLANVTLACFTENPRWRDRSLQLQLRKWCSSPKR